MSLPPFVRMNLWFFLHTILPSIATYVHRYQPLELASTARRLLVLLPDHDVTATLVTVMSHLDLGPDILASHVSTSALGC
jgi:hypothetical protein